MLDKTVNNDKLKTYKYQLSFTDCWQYYYLFSSSKDEKEIELL